MNRFVVVSGCSGGGKSTLIEALAARGFATVSEPGRRIVQEELQGDGAALPWVDPAAFARRAVAMASEDLVAAAAQPGWVFFDRGLVDAAVALEHAGGIPLATTLGARRCYHGHVFLTPPWPELFESDGERRHGFDAAKAEYARLAAAYPALGYLVHLLPQVDVTARAEWLLTVLDAADQPQSSPLSRG
ncbi:MAG TPA: AAA family ATPase [Sphingomonas sp.]|nr:AAA family ATPase [Sphingomonas sp.]